VAPAHRLGLAAHRRQASHPAFVLHFWSAAASKAFPLTLKAEILPISEAASSRITDKLRLAI